MTKIISAQLLSFQNHTVTLEALPRPNSATFPEESKLPPSRQHQAVRSLSSYDVRLARSLFLGIGTRMESHHSLRTLHLLNTSCTNSNSLLTNLFSLHSIFTIYDSMPDSSPNFPLFSFTTALSNSSSDGQSAISGLGGLCLHFFNSSTSNLL